MKFSIYKHLSGFIYAPFFFKILQLILIIPLILNFSLALGCYSTQCDFSGDEVVEPHIFSRFISGHDSSDYTNSLAGWQLILSRMVADVEFDTDYSGIASRILKVREDPYQDIAFFKSLIFKDNYNFMPSLALIDPLKLPSSQKVVYAISGGTRRPFNRLTRYNHMIWAYSRQIKYDFFDFVDDSDLRDEQTPCLHGDDLLAGMASAHEERQKIMREEMLDIRHEMDKKGWIQAINAQKPLTETEPPSLQPSISEGQNSVTAHLPAEKEQLRKKQPYWLKILLIKRAFKQKRVGEGEWIVWLDDDVVANDFDNSEPVLDQIINSHDQKVSLIVAKEGAPSKTSQNTGMILVRNDKYGRKIIEKLWHLSFDQRMGYESQSETFHEQEALDLLIRGCHEGEVCAVSDKDMDLSPFIAIEGGEDKEATPRMNTWACNGPEAPCHRVFKGIMADRKNDPFIHHPGFIKNKDTEIRKTLHLVGSDYPVASELKNHLIQKMYDLKKFIYADNDDRVSEEILMSYTFLLLLINDWRLINNCSDIRFEDIYSSKVDLTKVMFPFLRDKKESVLILIKKLDKRTAFQLLEKISKINIEPNFNFMDHYIYVMLAIHKSQVTSHKTLENPRMRRHEDHYYHTQ